MAPATNSCPRHAATEASPASEVAMNKRRHTQVIRLGRVSAGFGLGVLTAR
jgi:hypothetical protein